MTNAQNFASDRAQMEAQIAIAHALKMRRSAVRRAKVHGLWRNFKSLVARNRVMAALVALLVMMSAALLGMTWYVQRVRTQPSAPASSGAPKLSLPIVKQSAPETRTNPTDPPADARVSVGTVTTESDGADPVLRMDYQLSQPNPKGTTP